MTTDIVREFWQTRALLGDKAGTQDLIAAQLEREAIAKHVKDGMRVLDVGCGTGETGAYLLQRLRLDWWGLDYSEQMVSAAKARFAGLLGKKGYSVVWHGNILDWVPGMTDENGNRDLLYTRFDLIYSQRAVINLPSWETQAQAIRNIISLLKSGGTYLAVENCVEGLDSINDLRAMVGLPAIVPPWHNRYIHSDDMRGLQIEGAFLAGCEFPCSTYYLASRVFNAALAAQEGREPAYNAPINELALRLPSIGSLGQTRVWVWRRCD